MGTSTRDVSQPPLHERKEQQRNPRRDERGRFAESASTRRSGAPGGTADGERAGNAQPDGHRQSH